MKTLTTLSIAILMSLLAFGQDYELIPVNELTKIANRNAEALWGECFPAQPIPYYGQDDEIVAYRFNYAIGKPFPPKSKLQQMCWEYSNSGEKYQQWGGDDYAQILIGARNNIPVLLEYSKCLSSEYALGFDQIELEEKTFNHESVGHGKTYYLNHFNQWTEISNGKETKYICLSPTGGVLNPDKFEQKKTDEKMFCETGDFSRLWHSFKNGYIAATDGDTYIDYYGDVPFYDWSYGCSPTAATMIFAYYDNRSSHHEKKYSCFINNHYQRYDTLNKPDYNCHWDYNVSSLQRNLAIAMSTDTLTGSTQGYNIDNGMRQVANSSLGYSFDIVNRYTFFWTRIKDDINSSKPLIVSIPGHSTTGVGYNNSSDMVITHYTHSPPRHLVNVSRWSVDLITRVSPGGSKGASIKLVRPYGDPRYSGDGQGEVFKSGRYEEIKWTADEVEGGWVKLLYSTDGGYYYDVIVEETENDGVFDWLVPEGIDSEDCRVVAYLYDPVLYPYFAGGDGSWGNFIIQPEGSVPVMNSGTVYYTNEISRYFYFEHNEPSWAIIGNQSVDYACHWETLLYPNDEFNQSPLLGSVTSDQMNYIVVDGNHAPAIRHGIKVHPGIGDTINYIQYEGGNNELNLTPGTSISINWSINKYVEMYDIHLTPGQYFFKAKRSSGDMDVDMAFFSSRDGNYYKSLYEADYKSQNWGSAEESFVVNITEEDDYGLCLVSKIRGNGTLYLQIDDAFIWTGAENDNWHNENNWVGETVPGWGCEVAIPNRTNDPNIYEAEAHCEKINILQGAIVKLTNYNLVINNDLNLDGAIQVANPSLVVSVGNDVSFNSNGNISLIDGAQVQVNGDWTFEEGSSWYPSQGMVKFSGTENSILHVKSAQVSFHDLRISKTGGAWVAYDNCPNMEQLRIKGQFIIDDGAEFIQWALYNTIFEGPFLAYVGSEFHFVNGQAIFDYSGTGGISINSEPGSYFNNLTASCADWLGLSSDIEIRGNLLIEEGNFKTLGYDVYIKGDWNDEAWGFNHGNSRVIFNGSGTQTSYGGAFWELELNKPSGELRIRENTTSAQHYDWTQGTMRVNGGYFLAMDCEDNGIYGTVIVTSGTADFRQDPGQYFDMNANLEITGGELHLHGGMGMGFWPFAANASITMSDGLINIHDNGIIIFNSTTYQLLENITGGQIIIDGSLHIHRDDFKPTGGIIQLVGYQEDASLHSVEGANLFNLIVDKSSKKNKAIAANLVATGYVDINGDFTLDGGNFEAPTTLSIYGQFINNQTPAHFDELSGEVIFDGPENNDIVNNEVFYDLTIRKPSDYFIVNENVSLGVNGTFSVDEGLAYFMPGSEITLGEALEVNYGGTLVLEGTAENRVSVNQGTSKVNYAFDINPGGEIAAINTTFIFMDLDGINIHSGAYVWPDGAFHNCNFAYGLPGGTALTIDNGADLVIHDAYFLPNTTGMAHNVTKNVDNGTVFFDGAIGEFSGEAFENDPFNRVHWEYIPPFELPFSEDWSSGGFETNTWTLTGANWTIDASYGNELPSAAFGFSPTVIDYYIQLRSYKLNGIPHDQIQLLYDIAFEEFDATTLEQMSVRVVYPNGDFYTVANYTNEDGSFEFITETIDITEYAAGETFMVSFMAHGVNSWNIEKWNIDNIEVIGVVAEPGKLSGLVKDADNGDRIENALIEIIGTSFNQLTDNLGEFNIVDVPPGFYNVSISADGYLHTVLSAVEVKSEENTFLAIPLTPEPPMYCTELLYTNGCSEGDGLNTFILEEIVNEESGCSLGGYGNFTALSTELSINSIYPLQVSSNYGNQLLSVWVDFDDDFNFDDDERLISDFIIETADVIYNTGLEIPPGANPGIHRLRARTNWNQSSADPCATYGYGECEDYTVEIVDEAATGGMVILVSGSESKAPIENALVEILGTNWYGYTEEEGYCIIDLVESGIYDIRVSALGYEDIVLPDQIIYAGQMAQMEASLAPALPLTQEINLNEGWQGLSSYLMPSDLDIQTIFGPIGNQLTLVYNYEQMYWPNAGINTLNAWDHHDGFFIKMQYDATLNIVGFAEADLSCDVPASWSILPVICPADVMLTELFDGKSVKDNLVLIKEIAGTGVYWPDYNINTLGVLKTGKAYSLLMQNADEIVFPESPQGNKSTTPAWEYPEIPGWNLPVKTASSHVIVFPEHVLEQLNIKKENLIVAKTLGGLVCGMAPTIGNSALSIYGDDQTTFEKDGFFEGEQICFSTINPHTLQEQTLQITFEESWANHGGKFESNGISVVKYAEHGTTGLANELSNSVKVYPNPTQGKFVLDGLEASTTIEIFDAGGQMILQKTISANENQINMSDMEKGVYLARFITSRGTFTKRIVLL